MPKFITEFQGLTLGESLSDATFKLGIPNRGFPPLPPGFVLDSPAIAPAKKPNIYPREELEFLRRLKLENAMAKTDAAGGTSFGYV